VTVQVAAGAALGIAAQAVLVVGRVPVRPPAARHGARRCRRGSGNSSGSACRNRRNRGPHACCAPERRCAEFGVAKSRIPLARSSLIQQAFRKGHYRASLRNALPRNVKHHSWFQASLRTEGPRRLAPFGGVRELHRAACRLRFSPTRRNYRPAQGSGAAAMPRGRRACSRSPRPWR